MPKHPNKEIRKVLDFAKENGWKIEKTNGQAHAWGKMYCPTNDSNCRCHNHCITSIWSTPKNATNHAKQLERIVKGCIHYDD